MLVKHLIALLFTFFHFYTLKTIFDSICSIITNDEMPHSIKKISLKYLLTLATQCEAINDNLFIEHFMLNNNLFEAIIHVGVGLSIS